MNTIHRLHAVLVVALLLAILVLGIYSFATSYSLVITIIASTVIASMLVYILYWMFY